MPVSYLRMPDETLKISPMLILYAAQRALWLLSEYLGCRVHSSRNIF